MKNSRNSRFMSGVSISHGYSFVKENIAVYIERAEIVGNIDECVNDGRNCLLTFQI